MDKADRVPEQDRMESLITALQASRQARLQLRAPQAGFNLFTVFGIESDESQHSRFLAWLLDANSGHGQGSTFLRAFADLCHLDIEPQTLKEYQVRLEHQDAESCIDVMVYRPKEFLIYVENKVYSPEGADQIDREFRDMRRVGHSLRVPAERQFAVFLTPEGRRPVSGDATHWRSVSYESIAAAFASLLPAVAQDKVRYVLQDWLDTISTFGNARGPVVSDKPVVGLELGVDQETAAAKTRLAQELVAFLSSLETELGKYDWWRQGWVFVREGVQVYITHQNWRARDDYPVRIGIWQFTPEHILGAEASPLLYVWSRDHGLARKLVEEIKSREKVLLGQLDRSSTGYVVKLGMSKCLPEDADGYVRAAQKQIVDFFVHYARVLGKLDRMIAEYLASI
jgi:hypothetical protein